jgi:hypothetical protein
MAEAELETPRAGNKSQKGSSLQYAECLFRFLSYLGRKFLTYLAFLLTYFGFFGEKGGRVLLLGSVLI